MDQMKTRTNKCDPIPEKISLNIYKISSSFISGGAKLRNFHTIETNVAQEHTPNFCSGRNSKT